MLYIGNKGNPHRIQPAIVSPFELGYQRQLNDKSWVAEVWRQCEDRRTGSQGKIETFGTTYYQKVHIYSDTKLTEPELKTASEGLFKEVYGF